MRPSHRRDRVIVFFLGFAGMAVAQLRQLQFSPDGKHLLAQDDSEITVLTVEPFRIAFRIPAQQAVLAHFMPDSQEVVFASSMSMATPGRIQLSHQAPQVERWNIADRARTHTSPLPQLVCGTAALAPDGRTLVCNGLRGTLRIVDADSGRQIFEKKKFERPHANSLSGRMEDKKDHLGISDMDFSPDGRYLIALAGEADSPPFIWDSKEKAHLRPQAELKRADFKVFTFLAPDRIAVSKVAGTPPHFTAKLEIVAFPSGEILRTSRELPYLPGGFSPKQRPFHRAADPAFVIVHYVQSLDGDQFRWRTAAIEINTGEVIPSDSAAMDVFGDLHVEEQRRQVVALYSRGKGLLDTVWLHRN